MEIRIGCIVEGHGDREAVPVLLRRIAQALAPDRVLQIPQPIRVPKGRLLKEGELERTVELAARKLGGMGAVLVVLDADDDCPAQLGPELLKRATGVRGDIRMAVVVAKREFESWFLAAAESLRGLSGLAPDLQAPSDPEAVSGAKEWLSDRMGESRYVETLDQPSLAARLDLEAARRADSFDKLFREIARLLE